MLVAYTSCISCTIYMFIISKDGNYCEKCWKDNFFKMCYKTDGLVSLCSGRDEGGATQSCNCSGGDLIMQPECSGWD